MAHDYHHDPKGHEAGLRQDYQHDMGLGSDVIHLVQMGWRVVTWPVRLLLRRSHGEAWWADEFDAGEPSDRRTIRPGR